MKAIRTLPGHLKSTIQRVLQSTRGIFKHVIQAMKPRESVVRLTRWFAGAALIGATFIAGAYALQGLGLALLVVAAMFLTIEVIPGFHALAVSAIGMPVIVIATAWLTTHLVSPGTIVGAFALAFALIIKVLVVRGMRRAHHAGQPLLA